MGDCHSCDFKARQTAERGYAARISRVVNKREIVTARQLATLTDVPQTKIYSTMEILVACGLFEALEPVVPEYPGWYECAGKAAQRRWRVCNGFPRNPIKKWIRVM